MSKDPPPPPPPPPPPKYLRSCLIRQNQWWSFTQHTGSLAAIFVTVVTGRQSIDCWYYPSISSGYTVCPNISMAGWDPFSRILRDYFSGIGTVAWNDYRRNLIMYFITTISQLWEFHRFIHKKLDIIAECRMSTLLKQLWPLLLTWFNFNPSMDK